MAEKLSLDPALTHSCFSLLPTAWEALVWSWRSYKGHHRSGWSDISTGLQTSPSGPSLCIGGSLSKRVPRWNHRWKAWNYEEQGFSTSLLMSFPITYIFVCCIFPLKIFSVGYTNNVWCQCLLCKLWQVLTTPMQISKLGLLFDFSFFQTIGVFLCISRSLSLSHSQGSKLTADSADSSLSEGTLESFPVTACPGKWPKLNVKRILLGENCKK